MNEDFQRIYGRHVVKEALQSDRPVYKLWLAEGLKPHMLNEYKALARAAAVPVNIVPSQKINQMLPDVSHQGIVAETGAYAYADWDQWMASVHAADADPFILVLDQIQDPHNLGAILRTAEAAGVHGVIIAKNGGVGLSETVAKASAGAIEKMPVLQVTNIARTLKEFKEENMWCMGLSLAPGQPLYKTRLTGPIVLVIGNEQKGLRPNVEKHCDQLLHIPMQATRSLNASVAAAVTMYEVVRQRLQS